MGSHLLITDFCCRHGGQEVCAASNARAICVHSSRTRGLILLLLPTHSSGSDCMRSS